MAAFSTVRVLAAITILTSLVLYQQTSAAPAQQDSARTINVAGNRAELVAPITPGSAPSFASLSFSTAGWHSAGASPCQSTAWTLPPGATGWLWNTTTCAFPFDSIALRRTFVVPAKGVLTARLWFAVHGSGDAYVNGKLVGHSAGHLTLVDVTGLLHPNGAGNVLTFAAQRGADGGGIAYDLRLTLSNKQYIAYHGAHPSYNFPSVPTTLAPSLATPVGTTAISGTTTQVAGTCVTVQPTDIVPVLFGQPIQQRLATGWIYASSQYYVPNQPFVYVVTRLVDLTAITQQSAMPIVTVNNQNFQAVAVAADTSSGDEVLVLPPAASSVLTPLDLTVTATHNQAIGTTVLVTADSRMLGCLATYQPTVFGYPLQLAGQPIAELNTVPNNDAADGAVAQDSQGNFLGTVVFMTDTQGLPVPYVIPFSVNQPTIDSLIAVLAGTQQATATQELVKLGAGSSALISIHVPGTTASGGQTPAAVASPTATTTGGNAQVTATPTP